MSGESHIFKIEELTDPSHFSPPHTQKNIFKID